MPDLLVKYADNPEFQEFLSREFDKTAVGATIVEFAEFAFGSFDETVKAFEEYKRKGKADQNES